MDLWFVALWLITLLVALGMVWWNQQLERRIDHLNMRITRLNVRISTMGARVLYLSDLDRHEANMHHDPDCVDCIEQEASTLGDDDHLTPDHPHG